MSQNLCHIAYVDDKNKVDFTISLRELIADRELEQPNKMEKSEPSGGHLSKINRIFRPAF